MKVLSIENTVSVRGYYVGDVLQLVASFKNMLAYIY